MPSPALCGQPLRNFTGIGDSRSFGPRSPRRCSNELRRHHDRTLLKNDNCPQQSITTSGAVHTVSAANSGPVGRFITVLPRIARRPSLALRARYSVDVVGDRSSVRSTREFVGQQGRIQPRRTGSAPTQPLSPYDSHQLQTASLGDVIDHYQPGMGGPGWRISPPDFMDNECYPRDAGECRVRGDTGDKWCACVVVLFTVSGCSERRCATSALVQPSAMSESASSSRVITVSRSARCSTASCVPSRRRAQTPGPRSGGHGRASSCSPSRSSRTVLRDP
jgi:hypothetical protein